MLPVRGNPEGHIQTSLLESIVDLQFELLTTHLNDGFPKSFGG